MRNKLLLAGGSMLIGAAAASAIIAKLLVDGIDKALGWNFE